jgi:hypothetical protein
MDAKDDALTAGVERLNALLGWWGVPIASGTEMTDSQMKRLQRFASDLQRAYGDAYSSQVAALFSSNERLVRSFQDLLRSRRPQEVLAAESEILATFLEGASLHAKRWAELTQKLQECSAALAREAAEDLRQQAQETVSARGSGESGQHVVKQARKQSVRA